jgi:chorismate-pyruvate lyase
MPKTTSRPATRTSRTARTAPKADKASAILYPLDEFYAAAGLSLPRHSAIDGAKMLEPYRSLLVHNGDMTPALETHYRDSIHIERLQAHNSPRGYSREVVLRLDGNERAVEYGAIKINLKFFDKKAREEIVEGNKPLGAIMREYKIVHGSKPKAFLQVHTDGVISEALGVANNTRVFGRRNTLVMPGGEPLAEIVEILAPAL